MDNFGQKDFTLAQLVAMEMKTQFKNMQRNKAQKKNIKDYILNNCHYSDISDSSSALLLSSSFIEEATISVIASFFDTLLLIRC